MASADIFFLPSEWEGIALSVYEAMACGLPVVGADVGGQRELVTAECGTLIPPGDDVREVARYVEELSRLVQDPAARQAMGKAGRQRIADGFHLRHMAEQMQAVMAKARQLQTAEPRPQPGPGLGRACASQAVEYGRLAVLADGLWQEREEVRSSHPHENLTSHNQAVSSSWRVSTYFMLRRLLLRYYRAGLDRKLGWLRPLKDRLKLTFLGGSQSS